MQQTSNVTFAAAAAAAASGFPVVSVLTFKKQKDLLKKRREALIAGKGRNYRGVGTHRRSITKHTWTYAELAELSATFMTLYNTKPIWKIAQEIHASFAVQLDHQQALDAAAAAATDPQEEQVAQLREPRTHLPTATAIELKLMDCVSLYHNDTHNYISKPSQMHCEVWAHLLRARQHRVMIRDMAGQQQQERCEEGEEDVKPIWNVHSREFLYDTVAEYEAAFPPAKRRKLNLEDTATTIVGEIEMGDDAASNDNSMNMGDVCEALEEIAEQIDEREHNRQRTNIAVNACLAEIENRDQQISQLLAALRDTTSEIEAHRQAVAREMERIREIVDLAPPAYAAPAATTSAHVDPNDQFDPDHYQCRECSHMFDPLVLGYWLIGPNPETGDTFYLCRECTRFMEDTPQASSSTPTQRIDEEEDYSYDSEDEPRQGDYDHSEECS